MKLTYTTAFDLENINNWSGLGVYYAKMLRESGFANFSSLNLHRKNLPHHLLNSLKAKLNSHFNDKSSSHVWNITESKSYAHTIHNKIGDETHIISPNTVILAHLKKDLKKILYTDSTLANLLNFYSNYATLEEEAILEAQQVEQQAIETSDLLIYTSHWAAESAINEYRADAEKVFIVPFGANLKFLPNPQDVRSIIAKRNIAKHVNLLFIGVDWERKGGKYAVEVTQKLNQLGIRTTLHTVGLRNLPPHVSKEFIINHGFISKRTVWSETKLCKLISESDFLILPSLADCTPVAFSEANAFGVPCLASNVGGHTSVIKSGINGTTFSHADFVENSVNYIVNLIQTENAYQEFCFSSYNEYANELNWKSSGAKIFKLINSI